MRTFASIAAGLVALTLPALAAAWPAAWTKPTEPYHVAGNIYYVGSEGLSAYLISTSSGLIQIDGGMPDGGADIIEANIRRLGFKAADVKILLNTHAHIDHAGGLAKLKADTGAKLYASGGDRKALEQGRHIGDNENGEVSFPPVKVDRTVRDGDKIKLGETVLIAVLTPGHTPGCTTWTLAVNDKGRPLNAVFYGSTSVAGNALVGNKAYPRIVDDYRQSFTRLKATPADLFLPNHPEMADLAVKRGRALTPGSNPFVDPGEMSRYVARSEQEFQRELARQQGAAR